MQAEYQGGEELPFIIDQELKAMIWKTDQFADDLFEQDLIANDGPDEPLLVWDEENILVDGHRRIDVCVRNNLAFRVERRSFESRTSVMIWMWTHQLGRRNLLDHQVVVARGRLMQLLKETEGTASKAAEIVMKATNCSRRSSYRALEYVEGFDKLSESWKMVVEDQMVNRVKKYVPSLGTLSHEDQEILFDEASKNGLTSESVREQMQNAFPKFRRKTKLSPGEPPNTAVKIKTKRDLERERNDPGILPDHLEPNPFVPPDIEIGKKQSPYTAEQQAKQQAEPDEPEEPPEPDEPEDTGERKVKLKPLVALTQRNGERYAESCMILCQSFGNAEIQRKIDNGLREVELAVDQVMKDKSEDTSAVVTSSMALVDEAIRNHMSKMPRIIDKIRDLNGGDGPTYRHVNAALNGVFEGLNEMRKGDR